MYLGKGADNMLQLGAVRITYVPTHYVLCNMYVL
jgi:hypothetical protein